MRDGKTATLGQTFIQDAETSNTFSKLSRYESAIERQLYWALHELECRKAARRGATLALPHVLVVDVSGMTEEAEH